MILPPTASSSLARISAAAAVESPVSTMIQPSVACTAMLCPSPQPDNSQTPGATSTADFSSAPSLMLAFNAALVVTAPFGPVTVASTSEGLCQPFRSGTATCAAARSGTAASASTNAAPAAGTARIRSRRDDIVFSRIVAALSNIHRMTCLSRLTFARISVCCKIDPWRTMSADHQTSDVGLSLDGAPDFAFFKG